MSTVHPSSSIPELIKLIRHSFRDSEFDEVQKALMKREKMMQVKVENLVKECASLKKQIDFLENLQSFTVLEKCSAEEKMSRSERRCEELDKERVEMGETIRILKCEKLGVEEKLVSSERKCKEMEERLSIMGKEMEEKLGRSERRCEELDKESVKMGEIIRILRCDKLGVEEKLEMSKRKYEEMEERLSQMGKEMDEKLSRSERRCEELDKKRVEMGETIRILRCEKLGVEEKLVSSERKCEERLSKMAKETEKLGQSERRCMELDKGRVEMGETIWTLRCEKVGIEEKLELSERKCAEMEEKLAKMEKEMDELRRDASEVVEIEGDAALKLKNQCMRELRVKRKLGKGVIVLSDSDDGDEREGRNDSAMHRCANRKRRVEEGSSLPKSKPQSQE